ncbi:polymeric immunoglobulin receptor-like isoform X1 [Tachysurus fulvidraco]|uniref:polymeric immunoglobulin receptor-like isoform X1 n=1 Tax=Tachysurus fulvidraco TaxID=1234273 RepID=UPI001FEE3721|nr:polymeric immunoglobulin receptor-like isoform X1 [Tachysurus fulvidraco]
MKILLIFTFCLISDGGTSNEVTGYSGGGILIKCKYDTAYRINKKYFCRGSLSGCSDQIKTGDKKQWVNSGRFSLFDDTKSLEFRVMIRKLTVQDTGTYHCGVDITLVRDIYTPVELKVQQDLSYEKSISKTVHAGEDFTVSCKYPQSLKSYQRFLCKRLPMAACSSNIYLKESILNMTMKNVNEQDSGEYWCGADIAWTSDHGYKVYFTQIDLTVTAGPSKTTQSSVVSSSSSSSSSLTTSSPFSLSSSVQTTTFTRTGLSSVSIVVTVLVNILIGLLIGNTCLFVVLRIKRKRQGNSASHDRHFVPGSENSHEDFKDTRGLFASEEGTSTDRSAVQLPRSSFDPAQAVYLNILLPTSPCESGCTATLAQFPTDLPDSSISTVEKPEESQIYTTVRFHTNSTGSDDVAQKIKFKKEEKSCEYASVSHGNSYG